MIFWTLKATSTPELDPKEPIARDSWLTQAHKRQQALTGLQSVCNQKAQQSNLKFSTTNFCQLFSQEVGIGYIYKIKFKKYI